MGLDSVAVQSCSGPVWVECWACGGLNEGLGFVWGSFGLAKGLISRMLLGGLKVDFESAWVGLGLICATCAARCSGFRVGWDISKKHTSRFFRDIVARVLG